MEVQYTFRRGKRRAKFPNKIREYRLKAGLSQRKLAELLGRGPNVISAWERGHVLPTAQNLFRLAKTLNTLAEALYQGLYCTYPREGSNEPQRP
jgi:transcriptional regulator with XRE-family HTH domain